MKRFVSILAVILLSLVTSSAFGQSSREARLYNQIAEFGLSNKVAEWLAEEAARARVRSIKIGNTKGSFGVSSSNGTIVIQNSRGGRSIRNLTHEIAHIGAGVRAGHSCTWMRYLTKMALRYEEKFGKGGVWGTHSLGSYYPRYGLKKC